MFASTLIWLAVQGIADVGVLAWCARRRRPGTVIAGIVFTSGLALGLALALGERGFGKIRLATWAVFFHGPLFLICASALLRRTHRRWALGCALLAAAALGVAADAFLVEPHWLDVSHQVVRTSALENRVRIVVLADMQTDAVGAWEAAVLRRAALERPDLVLFPGDYLQSLTRAERQAQIAPWVEALRATRWRPRLGIFAVEGDVEPVGWPEIFEGTGVTSLDHTETLEIGELRLTGLSLADSRDRRLSLPDAEPGRGAFHVVVGHAPDYALSDVDADLMIAGHTHGGQVQVPGFGPLITLSKVPRAWAGGGLHVRPGGGHLVVSRGIGMERRHAPRLRFWCRPELVVIDVVPSSD